MAAVTPWWEALEIRPEIVNAAGQIDDVQMSLGDAVHASGAARPAYADAAYFGAITHPTRRLVDLLAKIGVRLGGGSEDYLRAHALTRLNQGMGGGKSHAEIAAWHMAAHPSEFFATDIGRAVHAQMAQIVGRGLTADLGHPVVVVLDLDKGTTGVGKKDVDGPFARNLYERFLWRLFAGDANAYKDYREFFSDKQKIGEALASVGHPVLIVVDEIMDYIGNGLTGAGDDQLTAQDMAFLRALLDVVNDVPNVAMMVAMIDPEKDRISLSADGKERQNDLNTLLDRNGKPATVNEDTDFTLILRRRLFTAPPDEGLMKATANVFDAAMKAKGWEKVYGSLTAGWVTHWAAEVQRAYPFHPQLMHLAEQEWAKNSGYQNVRSTIRVFAATVFAHQQRAAAGGWAPLLIGAGDLPLWHSNVRENIFGSGLVSDSSLEQNYRSIFQGDIIGLEESAVQGGQAHLLDLDVTPTESWAEINPHAHVRAATMIAVASLMPRRHGRRGAAEAEILIASAVPDSWYSVGDAEGVLERLTDFNSDRAMAAVEPVRVKGMRPRYLINPEIGVNVIFRQIRQAITPQDRDDLIADVAESLATTGPFAVKKFVDADRALPSDEARRDVATATLAAAGLDEARTTRLVVLDPAGFSLRNGMDEATKAAVKAVMGLGPAKAPVEWASSAVFVVVNTQRRKAAREAAADYLAWKQTENSPELSRNDTARDTAAERRKEAHTQLVKSLRRAYQHILYLSQPTPDMPRELAEITLEEDAITALDGTTVWKELGEQGKAFLSGEFTARALLHNLRDNDYSRPLAELRDAFWQAPRLPLLPGGEKDLRQAIYAAVKDGDLRLIDADGTTITVDDPASINLTSQGRRLAKGSPASKCPTCGRTTCDGSCTVAVKCAKCGSATCNGSCENVCTKCADPACDGTCEVPPKQTSQSVKFTLAHEVDDPTSAALTGIVAALYAALMAGDVSYVQGTTEIVTSPEHATEIKDAAARLGIAAIVKDL